MKENMMNALNYAARGRAILVFLVVAGCASTVPKELVDARAAYQRAASGPASVEAPAQLHVANQALGIAEKTYDDEGDSDKAHDRAYVATRKAELAEAQGRIAVLEKQTAESEQRRQAASMRAAADTKSQLAKANVQLATQQQQLDAERQLRQDAERKSREALEALERVATVKRDTRGTVITLPGGVLFASGKSELLASARAKLTEVSAAVLKDPNAVLVVEGHTDSRGSADMNQELSVKRAQAVRDFLVSKGVPVDHVTAEGFGLARPIADNNTAEGRADNRRVEIVVRPGNPSNVVGGGPPSTTSAP
jgi:outer membrane protein OmpA-like peptidoglycan-associated protein